MSWTDQAADWWQNRIFFFWRRTVRRLPAVVLFLAAWTEEVCVWTLKSDFLHRRSVLRNFRFAASLRPSSRALRAGWWHVWWWEEREGPAGCGGLSWPCLGRSELGQSARSDSTSGSTSDCGWTVSIFLILLDTTVRLTDLSLPPALKEKKTALWCEKGRSLTLALDRITAVLFSALI